MEDKRHRGFPNEAAFQLQQARLLLFLCCIRTKFFTIISVDAVYSRGQHFIR
jgi:hypothetical protein